MGLFFSEVVVQTLNLTLKLGDFQCLVHTIYDPLVE